MFFCVRYVIVKQLKALIGYKLTARFTVTARFADDNDISAAQIQQR